MGAENFTQEAVGATAEEAFQAAKEQAWYDHGHAGYTGTIAEKDSFVMIELPAGKDAYAYADELIEEGDARVNSKWGPAGCIALGQDKYLFFGWASS